MTSIDLQANARIAFLAIATGAEIKLAGAAKGGAIGSLIKRGLIAKQDGAYVCTPAGEKLAVEIIDSMKPAKQPKAKKADGDEAPRRDERTGGHIAAVRAALPALTQTDDEIAAVVWRVKASDTAVAKAKEAFGA